MSQPAVQFETTRLNVLIVEDSEEDADLIVLELRRGGYNPQFRRVETAEDMRRALRESHWDLILSDFLMPQFTMNEALSLAQERGVDLPFVIVSATSDTISDSVGWTSSRLTTMASNRPAAAVSNRSARSFPNTRKPRSAVCSNVSAWPMWYSPD